MRLAIALALVLVTAGPALAQGPQSPEDDGPFSVSAEALVWWFKNSPASTPLVTNGILSQQNTQVYLGGSGLDTGANPGFRVTAGYAFTEEWGVEGNFFYIVPSSTERTVSSSGQTGSTNLIIPYIDATTGRENGTELSLAPRFRGTASEKLENSLLGGELNGTWAVIPDGIVRVELLAGFRYLRLKETYTFTTSSPFNPPLPQDVWNTKDEFEATNNFYGAQAGVRGRYDWGRFFVTGGVKLALGAMVQSIDVNGSLATNDFTGFGPTQTFIGGYFALPTNIGSHTRTVFAVAPELGLNLGFRITPWMSVFAGYNFLYMNNVVRPGNQLDRNINTSQGVAWTGQLTTFLQGQPAPSFKFRSTDFWAQGVNIGLGFRF